MMIQYSREEGDDAPPAPFMDAEIHNPVLGTYERMRAKLDTGAAITAIPTDLVERLKLMPEDEWPCRGYDGKRMIRKLYFVNVELNGNKFELIEAIGAPRDNVLIGRNVLNQLDVHLDGKNLAFDVRDP